MLTEILERALARSPAQRPALVAEDEWPARVVTTGELLEMVTNLRLQLRALGVLPGHILPILARRTPEAVALALATLLEGAAFCFLNEKYSAADWRWLVAAMSPVGLVVDRDGYSLVSEAEDDDLAVFRPIFLATHGSLNNALPTLVATQGASAAKRLPRRMGEARSAGAVHVHFSSGSTGRAKGVLGSPSGLLHFARVQIEGFGLTPDDRLLSILGFSNNLGLVQMFTSLLSGATLHLTHSSDPRDIAERIHRAGITGISGSTGTWTTALAASPEGAPLFGNTPTLRYVSTGGARMAASVFQELYSRLGPGVAIYEIYGQAEIRQAAVIRHGHEAEPQSRAGSVGRAVPGTTLFVAQDRETLAAPRETGEVAYMGPGTMLGYLGDMQGSRNVLGVHKNFPGKTVVYTGDLGYLDEDGYLYLVGRADRRIDTVGHKVWPSDIEEVLSRHPGVIEPIVFGVPDPLGGQRIVAVVLAREGTSPADLRQAAESQLPSYMVPTSVSVWPNLPRTANGKPALGAIKAQYLAESRCEERG